MCDEAKQHASDQLGQTLSPLANKSGQGCAAGLQLLVPRRALFRLVILRPSAAVKAALCSGKIQSAPTRSNDGGMTERL